MDKLTALKLTALVWRTISERIVERRTNNMATSCLNTLKLEAFAKLKLEPAISGCHCCQYVADTLAKDSFPIKFSPGDCSRGWNADALKHCPLRSLWPQGCCAHGSIYWNVYDADENQAMYAMKISETAQSLADQMMAEEAANNTTMKGTNS